MKVRDLFPPLYEIDDDRSVYALTEAEWSAVLEKIATVQMFYDFVVTCQRQAPHLEVVS